MLYLIHPHDIYIYIYIYISIVSPQSNIVCWKIHENSIFVVDFPRTTMWLRGTCCYRGTMPKSVHDWAMFGHFTMPVQQVRDGMGCMALSRNRSGSPPIFQWFIISFPIKSYQIGPKSTAIYPACSFTNHKII